MSYELTDRNSMGSKFWDWPLIAIAAFIFLNMTQPWLVMGVGEFIVLGISTSAVFVLLWWSDKFEREPARTIFWAFMWGAAPACLFAYYLELANGALPAGVFFEETAKLIGLLMIIRRDSVQSWTDGFVMGGFIGLGFAAVEDVVYAINGENSIQILVTRGIFSIFAHTFFSGLGAAIIVMGYLSRQWWKLGLGFFVAFALHLSWNQMLAWHIFDYNLAGFFIFYSFLPPTVLWTVAYLLRWHEKQILVTQGRFAVQAGAMSEQELHVIVDLKARKRMIKNQINPVQRKIIKAKLNDDARRLLSGNYEKAWQLPATTFDLMQDIDSAGDDQTYR